MNIRHLEKRDIPHAVRIVTDNYENRYGFLAEKELRAVFIDSPYRPSCLVIEEDDVIFGFACFAQAAMDFSVYELFWVNVHPDHQREGLGIHLIETVIAEIRLKGQDLSPDEDLPLVLQISAKTALIPYYREHFGFQAVHSFSGGDQHLMVLSLED